MRVGVGEVIGACSHDLNVYNVGVNFELLATPAREGVLGRVCSGCWLTFDLRPGTQRAEPFEGKKGGVAGSHWADRFLCVTLLGVDSGPENWVKGDRILMVDYTFRPEGGRFSGLG